MSAVPHEVDVPVTDLDERDDYFRVSEEGFNLDGIDDPLGDSFETRFRRNPGAISNFFSSMWSHFSFNRTKYRTVPSQGLNLGSDLETESSEGSSSSELRYYKIERLNLQLHRVFLLVFIVGIFVISLLVFPNSRRGVNQISPNEKRILTNSTHNFHPTTIVVSLDGFHPHYINASNCPSMHEMLADGYGAPYMIPLFPSSTFPNHWTLVTGLHPSEHGIVGNTFYDPLLNKRFVNVDNKLGLDPDFWQGGEPIWVTAAKQGVKSAVNMWPGSEVPSKSEHKPLFVDKYNKTELLVNRVDRLMQWIDTDDINMRPELMLTYIPIVDTVGHENGIGGQKLTEAIRSVDEFIALMRKQLTERNLDHIVNLVVLSDHGMAPTSNDRLLIINDIVDIDKVAYFDGWPLLGVRPKEGESIDAMYNDIKTKLAEVPKELSRNYALYKVEDLPNEWAFGGKQKKHKYNYRLAPIWIIPEVGYLLVTRETFEENGHQYKSAGTHGYNNTHLLMRAIFLGQGPYFQEKLKGNNKKILPFSNLNVYNMICEGLNLSPGPNNGAPILSAGFPLKNILPKLWTDESVYPGLSFEVNHVVENATYDRLWRPQQADVAEVPNSNNNLQSLSSFIPEMLATTTVNKSEPTSFESPTASSQSSVSHSTFSSLVSKTTSGSHGLLDTIVGAIEDGFDYIGEGLESGIEYIGDEVDAGLNYVGDVVDHFLGNGQD